jgi:hypothetical protein
MTINIVIGLTFLLATTSALCQDAKLPVTFVAPKAWTLVETSHNNGAHQLIYSGSDPQGTGTAEYPATAMVQYFHLPPEGKPSDIDWIAASRRGSDTSIDSAKDGKNWKTFIWISYKGKQQIINLYRIGINDGYGVEFRYSFPHRTDLPKEAALVLALIKSATDDSDNGGIYTTKAAMNPMIDEFNFVCSTLKINNKNEFTAAVRLINPPPAAQAYRKVN